MCKWGTNKLVKLAYPKEVSKNSFVSVDACISHLVQRLNEHGVHTLGCCCGHGNGEGSITIHPNNFQINKDGTCEILLNRYEE